MNYEKSDVRVVAVYPYGMTHPVLLCPTHGNQGARITCKWCDVSIFDDCNRGDVVAENSPHKPADAGSTPAPATSVNRPAGSSSLKPGVSERVDSAPFSLDLARDQFQAGVDESW